ncbi:MAG TPA: tetratricopeptide repeat protein [Candidatus Limnocylindrales bacterium]|nr:tetratricopeptide repeat protein [Candidatus Limnocylindrales bacterium]
MAYGALTLGAAALTAPFLGRIRAAREAIACFQQAIELYRELSDRFHEADTLTHLGDAHHSAKDLDAARLAWQQALTILDELDHPDAERVRANLHRLV